MKIVVHYVMRYGLVVTNNIFIYNYNVDVLCDLICIGFVAEFVQQEGVDMVVSFSVGVRVMSPRQQGLKQRKSILCGKNIPFIASSLTKTENWVIVTANISRIHEQISQD